MNCKCGKEPIPVRGALVPICEDCAKQQRLSNMFIGNNIPKRLSSARLSDFNNDFDTKASLFIEGPAGTGKTHLAVALFANDILSLPINKYPALHIEFTSMINLLSRIKQSFRKDAQETEQAIVSHYCAIENLYIDDIGVEQSTEWSLALVYRIIDYRWGNDMRTVFTSNFDLDALSDKLDPRISSRIRGFCQTIKLSGKDRRSVK